MTYKVNIVREAALKASKRGTYTELSKLVKLTPQAVQKWGKQGYVPAKHIQSVSKITGIKESRFLSALHGGS